MMNTTTIKRSNSFTSLTPPPLFMRSSRLTIDSKHFRSSSLSSSYRHTTLSSISSSHSNEAIKYIASSIEIEYTNKPTNHSLYNLIYSEYFTIDNAIQYLNNKTSQSVIDCIINLIFDKYTDEAFFYLPQLCSLSLYKTEVSTSIESFLLENCVDKIKFSLLVNWFIGYREDRLSNQVEMTLVNGHRATISSFNSFLISKNLSEYDIFHNSINKELRLSYFNYVNDFYDELSNLCDNLIPIPKSERNDFLRENIVKLINKSKELKDNLKGLAGVDNLIRNLYYGYILPFNDEDSTEDESASIIVGVIKELSMCFNTKARVPIKIVVESVRVNECEQYSELYEEKERKEESNIKVYKSIEDFFEVMDEKEEKLKQQQSKNQKEIDKILQKIKYENEHPDKKVSHILSITYHKTQLINDNSLLTSFTPETITLFGDKWSSVIEKYKAKSSYGKFSSYTLLPLIAKSNDDLRQEHLALQLIKTFDHIFKSADLPMKLRPYEILITSSHSGLIEFIPNTISIDSLKKNIPPEWDLNTFYRQFYSNNFEEAQKNFAESLAGYSLVSYILDIKDRHNGNILIDINGNIIHIDFGFILGISPGNLRFESSPFKITNEYIQILDGVNSSMFQYFKSLLLRGFIEIRRHYDKLSQMIEIIGKGHPDLACFNGRSINDVLNAFKSRFHFECTDLDYFNLVEDLVREATTNWRTTQYDYFQKLTNDISP